MMKNAILGGALLLMSSFSASAMTQTVNLGGVGNMVFNGDGTNFTFEFVNNGDVVGTPAPFGDQIVNSTSPHQPSLNGKLADVDGLFTVAGASITGCPPPGSQCATVSGTGNLSFRIGFTSAGISAPIYFTDIQTTPGGQGTTGTVQVSALVNVGQFVDVGGYAGTDAGLEYLKTYPGGRYYVTFNPGPDINLSTFLGVTNFQSSFSATLTMVPEPSFYGMMLAPAVAGVLFLARKRKQADNA